jgi:hypothetical protein
MAVAVRAGIVTISGRAECRFPGSGPLTVALQAEGVVQVEDHTTYEADDRYPIMPEFW